MRQNEIKSNFLGQTDAASFLGLYPNSFVKYYLRTGAIPYFTIGKRKVFCIDDLKKLREERIKYHPEDFENGRGVFDPTSDYFNTCDAARYIGISYNTFNDLVVGGSIKYGTMGQRKIFRRDDLDAFKKEWKRTHVSRKAKGDKDGK